MEVDVGVFQCKLGGRQFNWLECGLVNSQFPTVLKINPKSTVLMQGPQSAVLAVKKTFLKTILCVVGCTLVMGRPGNKGYKHPLLA